MEQTDQTATDHSAHADHSDHNHDPECGHTVIEHNDHADYLHDGHLHHQHGDHYDEHVIEVSATNPDQHAPVDCTCGHQADCKHETIPHGDHVDFIVEDRLHYQHGDHCDDHGPVAVLSKPSAVS